MNIKQLADEVARRADTPKQRINVADVSRVLKSVFGVLSELPAAECQKLVADGLAKATKGK